MLNLKLSLTPKKEKGKLEKLDFCYKCTLPFPNRSLNDLLADSLLKKISSQCFVNFFIDITAYG